MTENDIAKQIVDAAFRIHTKLGPGLLESVYHTVLAYELAQRGLRTVSQQPIPVVYGTIRMDVGFRADLIVEDQVIVEIKSVEVIAPVHKKQLLTYLRLADKRLGLLINFNASLIKDGITRIGQWTGRNISRKDPKTPRTRVTLSIRLVGLRLETALEQNVEIGGEPAVPLAEEDSVSRVGNIAVEGFRIEMVGQVVTRYRQPDRVFRIDLDVL